MPDSVNTMIAIVSVVFTLAGLFSIGLGVANIVRPVWAWKLRNGGRIRGQDIEPLPMQVFLTRVQGVLGILIGMVFVLAMNWGRIFPPR